MVAAHQDRLNLQREGEAWMLSRLMGPHVAKKDQSKLDPEKLLRGAPGYIAPHLRTYKVHLKRASAAPPPLPPRPRERKRRRRRG
jgi:hypothetical protein